MGQEFGPWSWMVLPGRELWLGCSHCVGRACLLCSPRGWRAGAGCWPEASIFLPRGQMANVSAVHLLRCPPNMTAGFPRALAFEVTHCHLCGVLWLHWLALCNVAAQGHKVLGNLEGWPSHHPKCSLQLVTSILTSHHELKQDAS